MRIVHCVQEHFDLNAADIELNPINIENIELKDELITSQPALIIDDIEDVVGDGLIKKPLDKTR